MFLRRIFKNIPDVGPWVSIAELVAAVLTIAAILVGLEVVPNPFVRVASGKISGSVIDAASGEPVPESTVQIIDNESRMMVCESVPDAKGGFTETVKPGGYTVKAVCDGYRPAAKSISVLENKTRVVRLAITKHTPAEAKAAAQSGAAATKVVTVTVPVGGPTVPKGSPSSAPAASAPAGRSAKSKEALAQEQYQLAKNYYEQGNLQAAEDACNAAVRYDPTDGRFYATLIRISLQRNNEVAAKDYADEGGRKAKKNLGLLKEAAAEISPE